MKNNNSNSKNELSHSIRNSGSQDCKPNEHKPRDNAFGVTFCVKCGRLFKKPCGKKLQDSDKVVFHCS